jgi:hypothetical protein
LMQDEVTRNIFITQPMIQLRGSQLQATHYVEKIEHVEAAQKKLEKESRRYGGISGCKVLILDP